MNNKYLRKIASVALFWVFISSAGGAAEWNFSIIKKYSYPADLSSNRVLSISAGNLYTAVATQSGVNVYRKSDSTWFTADFPGESVTRVHLDGKDLWCMTARTILVYDIETKRRRTVLSSGEGVFNSFLPHRNMLLAASSKGLYMLNIAKKERNIYGVSKGLPSENILDITAKGDFIFASPASVEISRFISNGDYFANYSIGEDAFANSHIQLAGTSLWCGTNGRGLREFNLATEKWSRYSMTDGLADDFVQAMESDGAYLWVGTFDGLSVLNLETMRFVNIGMENGLPENSITALAVDGNNIWIGTDNGLVLANKYLPQVKLESDVNFFTESNIKDRVRFAVSVNDVSGIVSLVSSWSMGAFHSIWSGQNMRTGSLDRNNKAEAVWNIKNLASYNDSYFVKTEAVNALGYKNYDVEIIKFDAVSPIVKVDPVIGVPEAGPYKLTGTYNKLDVKEIVINPGELKAMLDTSAYSYSAIINLEPGINIVEVTIVDLLERKAVELIEIYCELKEEPMLARQDEEHIVPMEEEREVLLTSDVLRRMVPKRVFLSEMVLFYPASVKIRESSFKFMENLANILRKNEALKINIEGYAYSEDVSGTPFRNNKELSLARALVVGEYLVNTANVSKKRIRMTGLSSNKILVTPKSESDKNVNRRVEIHLYSD